MSMLDVIGKTFKPGSFQQFNQDKLIAVSPPEAREFVSRLKCKILSYREVLEIRRIWLKDEKETRSFLDVENQYTCSIVGQSLLIDDGAKVFTEAEYELIPSLFPEIFLNDLVDEIERINHLFEYRKKAKNEALGESKKT